MATVYTIGEPPTPSRTGPFHATVWKNGFRPFFLGGALFAGLAVPVWAAILSGTAALDGTIPAYAWHAHEMVFGFFAAILGGFLLTAIPNWTGRPPLAKAPLAGLFGLWLLGRIAMAVLVVVPNLSGIARDALIACDLSYLAWLAFLTSREVASAKAIHNIPVVALVGVLALANLWVHVAVAIGLDWTRGFHTALSVAMILIALIGGRTIPNFTRNWLMMNGKKSDTDIPMFNKLDRVAAILTAAAVVSWIALPDFIGTGVILALAAIGNVVRMSRWQGWRASAEPLLLILHVGYLWLAVAQGILATSIFLPAVIPATTALHALTAGAMGVMMAAFMTRATRGHTGRPLAADAATTTMYVLINLGALIRVAAPFLPWDYFHLAATSGVLWSAGFLVFALRYGPWMMAPRQ
jgi:uncharacterized protein involved in response to NO